MDDWSVSEIAGAVAILAAAVQLGVASWRDLGVVTLCVSGTALLLARGTPSLWAVGFVVVAVILAAVAWNRGARHGVGRPGLVGVGLVVGLLVAIVPWGIGSLVPPPLKERIVEVAVVMVGLTTSVGLALALERPGPRRTRKRWFRRVEIVEHPPRHRGERAEPSAAAPGEG